MAATINSVHNDHIVETAKGLDLHREAELHKAIPSSLESERANTQTPAGSSLGSWETMGRSLASNYYPHSLVRLHWQPHSSGPHKMDLLWALLF